MGANSLPLRASTNRLQCLASADPHSQRAKGSHAPPTRNFPHVLEQKAGSSRVQHAPLQPHTCAKNKYEGRECGSSRGPVVVRKKVAEQSAAGEACLNHLIPCGGGDE